MQVLKDLKEVSGDMEYVLHEYSLHNFTNLEQHDRGLWASMLKSLDRISHEKLRHHAGHAFRHLIENKPANIPECKDTLERMVGNLHTVIECLLLVQDTEDTSQDERVEPCSCPFASNDVLVTGMGCFDGPAVSIQRDTFKKRALGREAIHNAWLPGGVFGRAAKVQEVLRGYYLFDSNQDPVKILDFAVDLSQYRYAVARTLAIDLLCHVSPQMNKNAYTRIVSEVEQRHPSPSE